MSVADIQARRALACRIVAALGAVLDSLQTAEEIAGTPFDPMVDAAVTLQHLDEATAQGDTVAALADELATALAAQTVALRAELTGGMRA